MASASAIKSGYSKLIEKKLDFEDFAMELFHYQAHANPIYKAYLDLIKRNPSEIKSSPEIPCLPISFYKQHKVLVADVEAEITFTSSSTTGQVPSQHYITSLDHYVANTVRIFENRFGAIKDKLILGLLPSYLERTGSSLVCMVDHFIKLSNDQLSGFHLHDYEKLISDLQEANRSGMEVVLFAVRYALLDFAEKFDLNLSNVTIIETGGMKGKRGPVTNEELKAIVNKQLKPKRLISEYGMTELLSQAYSNEDFIFQMPDTMRVRMMDLNDPFSLAREGRSGQINIIDLANLFSCAFIATDDMGILMDDNQFQILGRLDNSEQRGCNLLVSDVIT